MATEFEFDQLDSLGWGRKWFVDINAGKTQLVLFEQSNNNAVDVKMDGPACEERSSSWGKMLGLSLSCKLDWGNFFSLLETIINFN